MIYKVNMSKGEPVLIDEEDLQKLEDNINEKLIRLKQAIINPSFMISIVPTGEEDKRIIPTLERRGNKMVQVGRQEVSKIGDVMNRKQIAGRDIQG